MQLARSEFNITNSLENGVTAIVEFLPKLVGFLIILLIGYIVARVVKGILTKLLQKVGLDKALHSSPAGKYVEQASPGASPAKLIGSIGFWLVFLVAISVAVSATGVPALTQFLAAIYAYLPKIIAALLIFVVAGAIATAVGALVAKTMGDTPTGKIVGTIMPVLVMAIAAFMILDQLEIAPQIVTITYAALLGALALGMALAFGLGGRDAAARLDRLRLPDGATAGGPGQGGCPDRQGPRAAAGRAGQAEGAAEGRGVQRCSSPRRDAGDLPPIRLPQGPATDGRAAPPSPLSPRPIVKTSKGAPRYVLFQRSKKCRRALERGHAPTAGCP